MAESTNNTSNILASSVGVMSRYPPAPVDHEATLYVTWYVSGDGVFAGSEGSFNPNLSNNTSNITSASLGIFSESVLSGSNVSNITANSYAIVLLGKGATSTSSTSWIYWSDIGSLDFAIKRSNVAGDMPLDWSGIVHNMHKLGEKVIAYGDKGVSILTPAGKAYGLNTIHRLGLLGRDAFAGNDFVHYFIDSLGCLYSLSDKLEKLDYKEYLSVMTNPVMTFDEDKYLIYICDGTYGYIYSPDSKSFGAGPVNVTGVNVSPGEIVTPTFEICTDIFDFGTRKMKSIYQLEFDTDVSGVLSAAVDYRKDKTAAFTTTPWKTVHERGTVKIVCRGAEFRFRAKLAEYEYFELDNFRIDGHVHVH